LTNTNFLLAINLLLDNQSCVRQVPVISEEFQFQMIILRVRLVWGGVVEGVWLEVVERGENFKLYLFG
jgi:hypothetical protein